MKKVCAVLAVCFLFGCVDSASTKDQPNATPEELRAVKPLGVPAALKLDSASARGHGVCASFDDVQDDLYCYDDDIGWICCTYNCQGCHTFPQV